MLGGGYSGVFTVSSVKPLRIHSAVSASIRKGSFSTPFYLEVAVHSALKNLTLEEENQMSPMSEHDSNNVGVTIQTGLS